VQRWRVGGGREERKKKDRGERGRARIVGEGGGGARACPPPPPPPHTHTSSSTRNIFLAVVAPLDLGPLIEKSVMHHHISCILIFIITTLIPAILAVSQTSQNGKRTDAVC
jgi:hypothetical protein